MGMMINRRRACGGKKLPYDAEINFLESTGIQWIDTGIVPANKKIGVVIDFKLNSTSVNGTSGVFGSNQKDGTNNIQFGVNDNRWRTKINNFGHYENPYNTNRHTIHLNMPYGSKLDNNVITATQYTIDPSNNFNCYLFACKYETGTPYINNTPYTLIGKIYSARVYDDDTLIRDFVPVRVGNVGYMYDKVSGQLFGNAGTGDFILGSDKMVLPSGYKQLEYIENRSNAYINTGVVLDFTETIDVGFELITFLQYAYIFGYYQSEDHNCTRLLLGTSYNTMCYATYNSKAGGGSINITQPFVLNTKYDVSLMPNNTVLVNNVLYSNQHMSGEYNNDAIYIFNKNSNGQFFLGRIYYFRIEGKRNYIPCINPNNVVGMYDTVNGVFYSSPNGTAFIAGTEV